MIKMTLKKAMQSTQMPTGRHRGRQNHIDHKTGELNSMLEVLVPVPNKMGWKLSARLNGT